MTRGPWRRWLLLVAVAGIALAGGGLWVAWYGAAGEVTLRGQVGWLNLGVMAVVASGLAIVVLLREARIRITDERRRLLRVIGDDSRSST